MTEGGTALDGAFHRVTRFHDEFIRDLFTHEVFSLLLREKIIGPSLVQKIFRWRHTGFNVHSKVRATDKEEAVRVGQYMVRPLLSLQRLSFDESEGKLYYQYSRQGSHEESMDYLEFIARVTSHIPDRGQVMVRYYGLYSNTNRGKMRKNKALLHAPIIEEKISVSSKGWAEMIRKVYETDPLQCPRCGGPMHLVAFIEDHKVIDKIIRHLKLTFEVERPPPSQVVQQELLVAAEQWSECF